MKVQRLSTTDGFIVWDIDDAKASAGVVRLAPKVLQDGAVLLARSTTYAFGAFSIAGHAGASAAINAKPDDREAALAAFVDEVRPLAEAGTLQLSPSVGTAAGDLAPLLPELEPGAPAGGDRNRLFDAVVALLRRLAEAQPPLAVILDDVHWLDEASLASQVRHPHVVETLDLGEQDRILYLVMEWVDGEPLNVIMHYAAKRGGIPQAIAVAIMLQALRGLHAAHELKDETGALVGLVHRDVTPQNVLVSYDGVVKLVDFGVAKATSRLSAETEACPRRPPASSV